MQIHAVPGTLFFELLNSKKDMIQVVPSVKCRNLVNRTSLLNKNTHTSLQHMCPVCGRCQMCLLFRRLPLLSKTGSEFFGVHFCALGRSAAVWQRRYNWNLKTMRFGATFNACEGKMIHSKVILKAMMFCALFVRNLSFRMMWTKQSIGDKEVVVSKRYSSLDLTTPFPGFQKIPMTITMFLGWGIPANLHFPLINAGRNTPIFFSPGGGASGTRHQSQNWIGRGVSS